MTELTLPAGSLQSALHAFAGGADAVYLGLHNYSARKHATNFSWEDLAQLKAQAIKSDKKIYVTLNTLLDDQELNSTRKMLRRLEVLQPDGIIVQDLGLARLIRNEFSSLELHCSTQLAVHTVSGVRALQEMGFERIVLSRELTFKEIAHIRVACPDVQLKTFIHGAMCYGFSGLCMASHNLTGRSANRGECAQICRTWFSNDQGDGYFFSMTDLAVGEDVVRLRDIGIDSLKIEGRMKSPAYVRFAAEYYRMILDGTEEPMALQKAREHVDAQFARRSDGGWILGYGKELPIENRHTPSLVTTSYPGHLGTQVATVVRDRSITNPSQITVLLEREVAIRDGILWLADTGTGIEEPIRFALQGMRSQDGKRLFVSGLETEVTIDVPKTVIASVGDPLYRVSRHNLHVPTIQEAALVSFQMPIDIELTIEPGTLIVSTKKLPAWIGHRFERSYPIDVQEAKKPQPLLANLTKIFSSPSEGLVTLGQLVLKNTLALAEEQVFLPLSNLKEIRRDWYEQLNGELQKAIEQEGGPSVRAKAQTAVESLPLRKMLSSPLDASIPWVDVERVNRLLAQGKPVKDVLAVVDGIVYIPLPPISFAEEDMLASLDKLVLRLTNPIRVGLNNVGHLQWAKRNPNIPCFADVYLYMTNHSGAQLYLESVPNPIGLYRWIERREQDTSLWPMKPSKVGEDFSLPLFISRACYRYDTLKLPCEGCPRNGSWQIKQSGKKYRVNVRNCLTVVSEEPEEQ